MMVVPRLGIVCVVIATLALIGCAQKKSGPICYPTRGQITYKNNPLAEAMVVLHRIGGDVEGGQKPIAYTDAEGKFALTTYKTSDGAPPGEYAITVELRAPKMVGEEMTRSGPNLLPSKYARPDSSGLKYQVVEGENEIPAIALSEK
jgi:hypothetical protein